MKDARTLSASGSNRVTGYITVVKMWNAYVTGLPVSQLKVGPAEAVPSVEGTRKMRKAS